MQQAPNGIDAYPNAFTGSGSEYFRVWIVNVLLTVVTFGFYTPIARRRTAQYFWGHTLVADSPLEFVAETRRMMVGFVLLVVLYAAFQLAAETGQEVAVAVMTLGGAALAPYFWGSAMRFRLNATRWRGVRLQFVATWGEVYRAGWPLYVLAGVWMAIQFIIASTIPTEGEPPDGTDVLLVVLTATGLVTTLICIARLEFNTKSLMVARGRIGGQPGRWKPVFGDFVRIWMATAGVLLATVVVIGALLALGALVLGGTWAAFRPRGSLWFVLLVVGSFVAGFLLLLLTTSPARAYREARIFRLVWNNIGVSRVARFKCDLEAGPYMRLRIRNVLLMVLTLGFWRPFALVSEYRMKAESVTLHVKDGLDQLAGQLAREEQGLGDALADAVGLDLVS